MYYILRFMILAFVLSAIPVPGYSQDAKELIYQSKLLGDQILTSLERATLYTCKYELKDHKVSCISSPRIIEYESITKYYTKTAKNGKRDLKNVRFILSPISERGIGILSYGYQSNDKDDDSWIYLSSLRKVRRITSSDKNRNEPETGSLLGTEYSVEDMTNTPIDDYTYKIIKKGMFQNRETLVIEKAPKAERLLKSNYSKIIIWLDAERKTIPKILKYNRQGQAYKLFNLSDWKKIDNIWIAKSQSVINLISKRKSTLKISKVKLNYDIDDEHYFSQRVLTDEIFRERLLKSMEKIAAK